MPATRSRAQSRGSGTTATWSRRGWRPPRRPGRDRKPMEDGVGETNGRKPDVVEEARRVSGISEERGVPLRLLGGVAINVRARDGLRPCFRREYADMDFIVPKGRSAETQKFFESLGYAPQTRFNTLYGSERLLFFDEDHDRQVDVLVGKFRMSHEIPFGKRLELEPVTIPLAELP